MNDDATVRAHQPDGLDGAAVAAWLEAHPDFFAAHPDLLLSLKLPGANGEVVSLVERQLGVLRERNGALHGRLQALTDIARVNHRIFERTLELTSSMIDAERPDDLHRRLLEGLRSGFEVDAVNLRVTGNADALPNLGAEAVDAATADAAIGSLLRSGRVVCGLLREAELEFLFGSRAEGIRSAAVMPVDVRGGRVLLALGSKDPEHFTPDMGTLFLRFLGETFGQRMAQLVHGAA